jgi:hypothetical protein
MSDDHSPGDARQPYSDRGGPEGRHAETHDVVREQLTNPTGPEPEDESFAEDIAPQTPDSIRQDQVEMTVPGDRDKAVRNALPELDNAQLSRLAVLETGTPLEQGSVYLDLNDRDAGPFTALGGQEAESRQRLVPKRDTDYELWNEITATGQDRPD